VSISATSYGSLLNRSLTTSLTTGQASPLPTSTVVSTGSTANSITSANSPDLLTQDMINLLKTLANGDVSGAKTDLAKFKTDLKTEGGTINLNNLAKDVTSLFKDLATGNTTAAKTDATRVSADLQPQETSNATSSQTVNPLESLVTKISNALSSGTVQSAVQDVAGYLVQNGQATGSLLNTSA
jgi:hypothetical protein